MNPLRLFKQLTVLLIFILMLLSCNNIHDETAKKLEYWMEVDLKLPNINQVIFKDSLFVNNFPINNQAKYKITTVIWGDCDVCIKELTEWKIFIDCLPENKEIEVYFYLCTTDFNFFRENLYSKDIYEFPLILDIDYLYPNINNLPYGDKTFQTFLLGKNNKVLLVGNPIYNNKLKELYLSEISGIITVD